MAVTETKWFAKLEIFTIRPFVGKYHPCGTGNTALPPAGLCGSQKGEMQLSVSLNLWLAGASEDNPWSQVGCALTVAFGSGIHGPVQRTQKALAALEEV